jgi:methionyl-tRNA formyltransferase
MGKIDWKSSAHSIINQVRGLQPWPGAYTFYNSKMLKITRAQISTVVMPDTRRSSENAVKFTPGQVINVGRDGFHVACLTQALLIKEVQPEAGKVMPADSFAAGHKIARGSCFH